MILFLKSISSSSSSRRVADDHDHDQEGYKGKIRSLARSDGQDGKGIIKCLTVWKKSLVLSCNGFTVIDSNGDLVYRVDNYICKPGRIVLMNASGDSILNMRRQKTIQLVDCWQVYDGEESDRNGKKSSPKKQRPIWYVKRHISTLLQTNSKQLAHVFVGTSSPSSSPSSPSSSSLSSSSSSSSSPSSSNTKKTRLAYVIEGSYGQRCCKVLDKSTNKVVAEIKRKEAINGCASFGQDVFHLIVWPGFDTGFAMALVLVLDQMFS